MSQRDPDLTVTIVPPPRAPVRPHVPYMRPLRVYVAGPFTGDVEGNCARAIAAGEALRAAGHAPFIPHLFRAWDAAHPSPYEEWMRLCFAWLDACEALVMIAPSPGALREWERAGLRNLPRFESVDAFIAAQVPR